VHRPEKPFTQACFTASATGLARCIAIATRTLSPALLKLLEI
jgi:hypothetical protein